MQAHRPDATHAPLFLWMAAILDGDDPTQSWLATSRTERHPLLTELITRVGAFLGQTTCQCTYLDGVKPQQRGEIESERIRLFQMAPGGVPVPPYASWWMDGRLAGDTSLAAGKWLQQHGVQPVSDHPDYLPTLLAFLARGIKQQQSRAEIRAEYDFMRRFLMPWIPEFCSSGIAATYMPFWAAIFDLVAESIATEFIRVSNASTAPHPT